MSGPRAVALGTLLLLLAHTPYVPAAAPHSAPGRARASHSRAGGAGVPPARVGPTFDPAPLLETARAALAKAEAALAPFRTRSGAPEGPSFWRARNDLFRDLSRRRRDGLALLDSAETALGSLLSRDPENRDALALLRAVFLREYRFEEMDSADVALRALGDVTDRIRFYYFAPTDEATAAPESRVIEVVPIPKTPSEVGETLGPEEVLTGDLVRSLHGVRARLEARDVAGLAALVHPDFRGAPLARAPLPDPPTNGAILTGAWPVSTSEVDAAGFLAALERYLAPVASVTHCKFYPIGIHEDGPNRISAWVDFEFDGLDGRGGRLHDAAKFFISTIGSSREVRLSGLSDISNAVTARGAREWFTDVSDLAGLGRFPYPERIKDPDPAGEIGAATAVADYDGDGRDDFFIGWHSGGRLYRNRGDGRFEDVTVRAGLDFKGDVAAAVFFDSRNRGRKDLFVACYEPSNLFFENRGDGTFVDRSRASGLAHEGNSSAATVADFDRDGFLDLYVGTFKDSDDLPPPHRARDCEPDLLYRNRGDGTFSECAAAAGIRNTGRTLDAMAMDRDGDGLPDLVVANDFSASQAYRNVGGFRFRNESARVVDPLIGDGGAVMGIDLADVDGDGRPDLFLSRMLSHSGQRVLENKTYPNLLYKLIWAKVVSGSVLFRNAGGGDWDEISTQAGIRDTGWSWGANFLDFDGDGNEDLLVTNGMISGQETRDL